MEQFLTWLWLKGLGKPALFVAHNCQSFDICLVLHATARENVLERFQGVVVGFSNFLLGIKLARPGLSSYSLPVLH